MPNSPNLAAGIVFFIWSLICFSGSAFADLTVSGDLESGPYTTTGAITSQGSCSVGAGRGVFFAASGQIVLSSGFHVEDGAVFLASIGNYSTMGSTTDSDGDSLSDWWEMVYFSGLGPGANGDYDGDGFTNLVEFLTGTSPSDGSQSPAETGESFQYDNLGRIKSILRVR